jgi:hypothetical protein
LGASAFSGNHNSVVSYKGAVSHQLKWIENGLKEDSKRNRKDFSVQNLSLLRKTLLNVAQSQEPKKISKKRTIKKMIWKPEYCLKMLAKMVVYNKQCFQENLCKFTQKTHTLINCIFL